MSRTMAGLLRERAESRGDELAIRFKKSLTDTSDAPEWDSWTWGEYWLGARRAEAGLWAAGVRPGDHVLMLIPDVKVAVATLFGAWALGAVPIQIGLPFRLSDIAGFLGQLRVTAKRLRSSTLVVSQQLAAFAPMDPGADANGDTLQVLVAEEVCAAVADGVLPDPEDAPGPALIQLTSGSTGHPRGVVLPHDRLGLHMACMAAALPSRKEAMAVSWLPLHHDMGLIGGLLFPFYNGFPAHMLSPIDFRSKPLCWLEAMSQFKGTICAAPPSAYSIMIRLAGRAAEAGLDLSSWECAMVGAEPISPELLRRFSTVYAPLGFRPQAFFPVYGLAEATVAVSFPTLLDETHFDCIDRVRFEQTGEAVPTASGSAGSVEFVGLGRPIPETEVRIVDEQNQPAKERTIGEIMVKSPSLMAGYYDDPAASQGVIEGEWLRTGDLGYTDGKHLYITGRKKDVIIKGGQNLLPQVIEEIAGGVDGVRSGCVAAVGVRSKERETELAYVVAETKMEVSEHAALGDRIWQALRAQGVSVDHIEFVEPGTLPKTTSGKLKRRQIAEAIAEGRPLASI